MTGSPEIPSSLLYGPPSPRRPGETDLLRMEDELQALLEGAENLGREEHEALVDFLWRTEVPPSTSQLAPLDSFCKSLWKGIDHGAGRRPELEAVLGRLSHRMSSDALQVLLVFFLDDPLLESQHDYLTERLSLLIAGGQVELERRPIRISEHRLGRLHTTHWQAAGAEMLVPRCLAKLEKSRREEAARSGEDHVPLAPELEEDGIGGEVVCGLCRHRLRDHPETVAHREEMPSEWVTRNTRALGSCAEEALRDHLQRHSPISRTELSDAVRMALWSVVVDFVEQAFAGAGGPLLEHEDLEALRGFWDPSIAEPPTLPRHENAVLIP